MPRPPRIFEQLVTIAFRDQRTREMVLGDLHEEYQARAQSGGGATRWYVGQAIALTFHALTRRQVMPAARAPSGDPMMSTLLIDLKYGARSLRKRPGITAIVALTLTLALGLGANAAVFNMIDVLVLRPYPLPDVDRMVVLSETGAGIEYRKGAVSPANFLDWRERASTVRYLTALGWWDANLIAMQEPERLQGYLVSFSFFDAVGTPPTLGRGFVRDDEIRGRHHVVVIGDGLWKRRFAADPGVIGKSVTIDGELYQIVGVAPPRFEFPDGAELWAPLSIDAAKAPREARCLTVIGRLTPGRTGEEAQAEMSLLATHLAQQFPDANRDHGIRVSTFRDGMSDGGTGPILALWQASAAFVLLTTSRCTRASRKPRRSRRRAPSSWKASSSTPTPRCAR